VVTEIATPDRRAVLPEPAFAADLIDESRLDASDATAVVAVLRECMERVNDVLDGLFRAGGDIQQLVEARAWAVDRLLNFAWEALMQDAGEMALLAVGGFGRGHLHPHSDIDLLLLHDRKTLPDPAREAIEQFVTVLWDAGFYLGHSVRNLQECYEEVAGDVSTATSLMEVRLLCGPVTLYQDLVAAIAPDRVWPAGEFFHAKFKEQQARHAQFGETAYNLEPNIKEGPGGLRDIQMISWVTKRHFGDTDLHGLVRHGFLMESEYRELVEGQRYLWRVRYALHVIAGRAEDRLLFEFQRQAAELFGYEGDPSSNEAVEHFMQGYYREVTRLERLNERLLQLFREELLGQEALPPEPLGEDFQLVNGYLEVKDPDLFQRRPIALMELVLLLARHEFIQGVRASTVRLIVDNLHLVDEQYREDPRVLGYLLELLRQPQGVYSQLQRMNRYGLLARLIPGFGSIVGRMQFDLFHVYTVDQHILFVVRNLRRFAYGKYREIFPRAPRVFQGVRKPELLYLAALFHDIAKGRGGDHSELGAADALAFCHRLPLPEEEAELVAWLVQEHLLMSQTAQKKDISDPATVREFAAKVKTQLRLDYLYLLTVADISATSPRLWNSWKSGLLWELRQVTSRVLAQDPETPQFREQAIAQSRVAALHLLATAGVERDEIEAFWDSLPSSVFLRWSADQLAWATQEVLQAPGGHTLVALRPCEERQVSEVLIVAGDYTGLFATVTAVFDEMGLDVLSARVATGSDERSFDLFQVMNRLGEPLDTRDTRWLQDKLGEALTKQRVLEPVQRPMPRRLRPFVSPPEIHFRPGRDGRVTELEIGCTDQPGLLSKLSAAMRKSDVSIHDAMISTLGDRVEDTFYLTGRDNRPLDDAAQRSLAEAIEDILE
jgi:[protein-PII] uridylyltransferase